MQITPGLLDAGTYVVVYTATDNNSSLDKNVLSV